MTSAELAVMEPTPVARPLSVLTPLIKDDIQKGDGAGMVYYIEAGKKLLEAKTDPKFRNGGFIAWATKAFKREKSQLNLWMRVAQESTKNKQNAAPERYENLDDFRRRFMGEARIPGSQRDKPIVNPVRKILNQVDVETLRDTELKRREERQAELKLALQLIEIGYRALATKLHPDKGGSRDAMQRLVRVRDRLKASA